MATPKEMFEGLKKGVKAANPFGGNAVPPKKSVKPDMGKIRAKGKEILKKDDDGNDQENPLEDKLESK